MTTPAISRDIVTPTMRTVITSSDTIPPASTDLGMQDTSWDSESRPQSSNGPLVKGFRYCHPWSHSGRLWSVGGGTCQSQVLTGTHLKRVWPGTSFWNGGNHLTPPLPLVPSQNLINTAEVKALNKLKSQDLHLGNFLAEGRRTINMVAGTALTIARGINRFRHSSPSGWINVTRYQRGNLPPSKWNCIPNAWLQLQYGWLPLLSDVYGAINHLDRRSRFEIPYVTVRSGADSTDIIVKTVSGATFASVAHLEFEQLQQARVTLVYGLIDAQLAELSSLGLINPVEIVWELLPYSFVVDWLVPIGTWLSALTADAGFQFVTGTKSLRSSLKFKGIRDVSYSAPNTVTSISAPTYSGHAKSYTRTCYAGSPVPGLYVKSPLSVKHMLNALALLAQSIGRR